MQSYDPIQVGEHIFFKKIFIDAQFSIIMASIPAFIRVIKVVSVVKDSKTAKRGIIVNCVKFYYLCLLNIY